MKLHGPQRFAETARTALDGGAVIESLGRLSWNLARTCEAPVYRQMTSRDQPEGPWITRTRTASSRSDIDFEVPCRRCGSCLKRRAAHWRMRAAAETAAAPRTWFVTLTFSPAEHFRMMCQASARLTRSGASFEALGADEQFAERHRECAKEITLWLKRVRKNSGVELRYFLVAEAHKSGLPHYHLLVHEVREDAPVRAKVLKGAWKAGFSSVELVAQAEGQRSAAYVAKYMSKDASARARASRGYGMVMPYSESTPFKG